MPIYDFSEPEWTDAKLNNEYDRIDGLYAALVRKVQDDSECSPTQRILDKQYSAKLEELESELERRKGDPQRPSARQPQRGAKKPGKRKKEARLRWRYAPVPLAIVDDAKLSSNAVRVAAVVARSINLGKWNDDLAAKLTYAELGERTGLSVRSVARALTELKTAGRIEVESLYRGGCRITFMAA